MSAPTDRRPVLRQAMAVAVALLMLGGVFAMYQHPDILFTLANQLWTCF